jgi:hypothetical protein
MEEVRKRSEQWRSPVVGRRVVSLEIGPRRRDERAAAIGKHEGQAENPVPVRPAKNLQGLPAERMVIAHDGDFLGKTLDVGSMS